MKKRKAGLGIIFITLSVVLIALWHMYGKEFFLSEEIIILNKNIPSGVTITNEDIDYKRTDKSNKHIYKKGDEKLVVGKTSIQWIAKAEPLYKEYFISRKKTDMEIITIPKQYCANWHNNIAKGDFIKLYYSGNLLGKGQVTSCDNSTIVLMMHEDDVPNISSYIKTGGITLGRMLT